MEIIYHAHCNQMTGFRHMMMMMITGVDLSKIWGGIVVVTDESIGVSKLLGRYVLPKSRPMMVMMID